MDVRLGVLDIRWRRRGTYQLVSLVKVRLIVEGILSHVEAVADNARQSTIIQYDLTAS